MYDEDPLRSATAIFQSSHVQAGASRMHSQDLREALVQTQDAILNSLACMHDCDRVMERWWYRSEPIYSWSPDQLEPEATAGTHDTPQ